MLNLAELLANIYPNIGIRKFRQGHSEKVPLALVVAFIDNHYSIAIWF